VTLVTTAQVVLIQQLQQMVMAVLFVQLVIIALFKPQLHIHVSQVLTTRVKDWELVSQACLLLIAQHALQSNIVRDLE
jgi:hypothetical protein